MRAQELEWSPAAGWSRPFDRAGKAQLVLLFASRAALESTDCCGGLRAAFPGAAIIGCSTGGQITRGGASDERACALAFDFARTRIRTAREPVAASDRSAEAGFRLASRLAAPDLVHVLVFADGLCVNGSELVAGLRAASGAGVTITGGLAGDGARFERTLVVADDEARGRQVAAVGLYGSSLVVGHGTAGGWDTFGPRRRITRSCGNVLHELDGKPALTVYRSYLEETAAGSPRALLHPLLVSDPDNPANAMVRSVQAVDLERSTMTLACDVPSGWSVQLMRGYFDRLVEGAAQAAKSATTADPGGQSDRAALLISCYGRRLLMGEAVIEEIAAARRSLGARVRSIGFYAYGEIAPLTGSSRCELHNQTMTVTTFCERL